MVEGARLERVYRGNSIEGSNPSLTANISSRINEMGLAGPGNPQHPRGFPDRDRTSETDGTGKIGLQPAFVSFHPNPC